MAVQSIGFRSPKPRDRTGNEFPESTDIPRMRPLTGKRATTKKLAALLESALEGLAETPCCFWACEGAKRPQHMVTCSRCWALRDIAKVMATLKAAK